MHHKSTSIDMFNQTFFTFLKIILEYLEARGLSIGMSLETPPHTQPTPLPPQGVGVLFTLKSNYIYLLFNYLW